MSFDKGPGCGSEFDWDGKRRGRRERPPKTCGKSDVVKTCSFDREHWSLIEMN